MTLVFQYGSNTSSSRFNSETRLRGEAEDLGLVYTEEAFELSFDVWSGGNACAAANIRRDGGRRIWGVLYKVPNNLIARGTAGTRRSLDGIEGSRYQRHPIRVCRPDGTPVVDEVVTYTALAPQSGLLTSSEYAGHIITGLKEHGAPADYISYVAERTIANNPALSPEFSPLIQERPQVSTARSRPVPAEERRSAAELLTVLLRDHQQRLSDGTATPSTKRHLRELCSILLWKHSQSDGKYRGCLRWSKGARAARKKFGRIVTSSRTAGGEALRHEHLLPRQQLVDILLTERAPTIDGITAVLNELNVGVVVTADEHRRLPPKGDPKNVWARYKKARIHLDPSQSESSRGRKAHGGP